MSSSNQTTAATRLVLVLGAPDPEMAAIEGIARGAGVAVMYAAKPDGSRVDGGSAYAVTRLVATDGTRVADAEGGFGAFCAPHGEETVTVVPVECDGPVFAALKGGYWADPTSGLVRMCQSGAEEFLGEVVVGPACDHHRPGDAGYGRPAAEFLAASSIGQVVALLAARGLLPYYGESNGQRLMGANAVYGHEMAAPAGEVGAWRYIPGWGWRVTLVTAIRWQPAGVGSGLMPAAYSTLGDVPETWVLAAAGDHCPGAAYRGECPGVNPDALMDWRVRTRAQFQGRSPEAVLADVARARAHIAAAPTVVLGGVGYPTWDGCAECPSRNRLDAPTGYSHGYAKAKDLRACGTVAEVPEAALRDGVATLARVREKDGRSKLVLGGAAPDQDDCVLAFVREFGPGAGLTGIYSGGAGRGFAGGYEK